MSLGIGVLGNTDITFKRFSRSVICFGKLLVYDMVIYFLLGKRLRSLYTLSITKSVRKFGGRLKNYYGTQVTDLGVEQCKLHTQQRWLLSIFKKRIVLAISQASIFIDLAELLISFLEMFDTLESSILVLSVNCSSVAVI